MLVLILLPNTMASAAIVQKGGINSLLKIVIKAKVISENYQITESNIEGQYK